MNDGDSIGRPGLRHRFRNVLKKAGDSSRAGNAGRRERPDIDGAAVERDQSTRFEISATVRRRAVRAGFPGARAAYSY